MIMTHNTINSKIMQIVDLHFQECSELVTRETADIVFNNGPQYEMVVPPVFFGVLKFIQDEHERNV